MDVEEKAVTTRNKKNALEIRGGTCKTLVQVRGSVEIAS